MYLGPKRKEIVQDTVSESFVKLAETKLFHFYKEENTEGKNIILYRQKDSTMNYEFERMEKGGEPKKIGYSDSGFNFTANTWPSAVLITPKNIATLKCKETMVEYLMKKFNTEKAEDIRNYKNKLEELKKKVNDDYFDENKLELVPVKKFREEVKELLELFKEENLINKLRTKCENLLQPSSLYPDDEFLISAQDLKEHFDGISIQTTAEIFLNERVTGLREKEEELKNVTVGGDGGGGKGDGKEPQPRDDGNGADVAGEVSNPGKRDEDKVGRGEDADKDIVKGEARARITWQDLKNYPLSDFEEINKNEPEVHDIIQDKENNTSFGIYVRKSDNGNYYYTDPKGVEKFIRGKKKVKYLQLSSKARKRMAREDVMDDRAGEAVGADAAAEEERKRKEAAAKAKAAEDAAAAAGVASNQAKDTERPTPRVQDTAAAFDPNLTDIEIMPRTPEGFSRCEKMMKDFTDWHNQVDPDPDIYVYKDNVIEEQKKLFLDLSNEIWLIVFKYGPEKESQDVVGFAQCQRLTQDHFGKTMNLDKLWIVPNYAKPGMGGHFCRASIKKVIQNQKENPFSKIHAMVIYKNLEALSFFNKKFNMSFNFSKEVIDGVSRLRGGTFGDLDEDDRKLVYNDKTKTSTPDQILELVKTNEDFYKRCFDRISKGVLEDMVNGQDFNIAANVSLNGDDLTFKDCWDEDFNNFVDAIRTNNGSMFQPFNVNPSLKETVKKMAHAIFNDNKTSLRRSIADHVLQNKEWREQEEKDEVNFDDKFMQSCKKFTNETESNKLKLQMLQILVSEDEGPEPKSKRSSRKKDNPK